MNVITSQDVALIGCCPCLPDACEAPRIDCQSISVSACGNSLQELSTVPAEDRCKIFRKRTESLNRVSSQSGDDGRGNSYTDNEDETTTVTYQKDFVTVGTGEEATRTCTDRQFSTSYTFSDTQTDTPADPEADTINTTVNTSSSSGIDVACSGTTTTTSTGIPDETDDYNICPLPFIGTPTVDWTYTTLGVFSESETTAIFDGTQTSTFTITYSEQVTIASLEAEIEVRKTMLADEDWPGGACSSKVEFAYGLEDPPDPLPDPAPELAVVCEQVNTVTKARYRFGVPFGYSTEEMPRSTWEMEWDEATASADWWEWFDTGMTGTEPTPGPTLTPRSWIWAGDMGEPWSNWFELSMPEEAGENRVINVMVKCFNSTRLGVKPTASGDSYNPAA